MSAQGTDEWLADRLGKVTASRISDVMMAKTTAGYSNYRAQLLCERLTGEPTPTFKSAAMDHGTETEPRARAMYELECNETVLEVGMIPHPALEMSGASPDGLVGDLGLVEIKCPQQAEHIRTLTGGAIKKGYMLQMQWQMECTGREFCDFVSFNPSFPIEMQLHRVRIDADAEMQAEIRTSVTSFLAEVDALEADLRTKFEQKVAA